MKRFCVLVIFKLSFLRQLGQGGMDKAELYCNYEKFVKEFIEFTLKYTFLI